MGWSRCWGVMRTSAWRTWISAGSFATPGPMIVDKLESLRTGAAISKLLGTRRQCTSFLRAPEERSECLHEGPLLKEKVLSGPGSLSADEINGRLFISDTNHHRIIIVDTNGNVLDCIGSSPGFEDGPFESAQLCKPMSTAFDADANNLFIADSENHAIRKADLNMRTLRTVFPCLEAVRKESFASTTWNLLRRWMKKLSSTEEAYLGKSERESKRLTTLSFPWALALTEQGELVIANRGFKQLWMMSLESGEVSEGPCSGSEGVVDEFLNKLPDRKGKEESLRYVISYVCDSTTSPGRFTSADFFSLSTKVDNLFFWVDTEQDRLQKMDLGSGIISLLKLSNLGVLGLPWWWSLPVNLLDESENPGLTGRRKMQDTCHSIQTRPGRFLIGVSPIMPKGMMLAAPVEQGSVWRRSRGSVVELSLFDWSLVSHQISGAQQWVDDMEDDLDTREDSQELTVPPQSETGLPIYCLVDTTIGSGDVVVDAVLYLQHVTSTAATQRTVERSDLDGPDSSRPWPRTLDADEVYLKHLHVRVKFEILDGASVTRTKEIFVQL